MTPQEKAKELRDKYIFTSLDSNDDYETLKLKILIHAKHCALIVVDEIMLTSNNIRLLYYFAEVKKELEKL
jgi:hypothetical protein